MKAKVIESSTTNASFPTLDAKRMEVEQFKKAAHVCGKFHTIESFFQPFNLIKDNFVSNSKCFTPDDEQKARISVIETNNKTERKELKIMYLQIVVVF